MKIRLSLATLGQLDLGKVDAAFANELRHVVKDCIDRPHEGQARKVVIELAVTPRPSDGVCSVVDGEFTLKSTVPPRRTRPYEMAVHASGALMVNPESPEDVRQGTLDELRGDEVLPGAGGSAAGDRELDQDEGVSTSPSHTARKPRVKGVDGKGTYEPS